MQFYFKSIKKLFSKERVKLSIVIGFITAMFISFAVDNEMKELSFLFPEFSISSSVRLDDETQNKAENSDDLVVEVEEKEKPEVRFFIIDFFKSLF